MKKYLFVFVMLLVTFPLFSQIKVDCDGFLENIYDKYIIIQKGSVSGIIDTAGKTILDVKYKKDAYNNLFISDNIFYGIDANTSMYTLVNLDKNLIIKESKYFEYSGFNNGYACIREYDKIKKKILQYFIDKEGNILCFLPDNASSEDNIFYSHGLFYEGLAKISFKAEKSSGFHESFAGYGYIDKTGKVIINPQFSGAYYFYEVWHVLIFIKMVSQNGGLLIKKVMLLLILNI